VRGFAADGEGWPFRPASNSECSFFAAFEATPKAKSSQLMFPTGFFGVVIT
jgi:hypothetical protein